MMMMMMMFLGNCGVLRDRSHTYSPDFI